jgi:DNA-binding transcriptional LysR family regulator
MRLSTDSLEAFVAFSETRNFTRAAEQLRISQPALHVKIKALAEQLGVPLYVRDGRELKLTKYGVELARFGRETQSQMDSFVEELLEGNERQPVVLAAGAGCYMYLLGDAIRKFRQKSSSPLKLLTADRNQTLELIASGQCHMGVTALETPPDHMESRLLASVPSVPVMPEKHRIARKRSIAPHDLENLDLIVPSREKPHRTSIDRVLNERGIRWNVPVETSGWEVMLQFVRLGLGGAIINGCCAIPRGLKAIPIQEFPATKYWLLSKRNLRFGASQQLLTELIARTASESSFS